MSEASEISLIISKSKDELLIMESAETLKSYVIDEIRNSHIFNEIFNVNGEVLDKLLLDTSDLFLQILPQTATEWGIKLWEKRVGIITNTSKTIEERRARILAKLRNKGTTTVEVIKQICRSFASDVEVAQYNSDYYFEINLLSSTGFPYELESMYDLIDIVKPAHLGTKYKLISISKAQSYFKMAAITGEVMTVYPWIARNIETSTKLEVGVSQNKSSESMTIYPRKESN